MKKKILFLVNDLSFFISHRLDIALAAKKKGYEVKIAYGELGRLKKKNSIKGMQCFQVPLKRGSINPFRELWAFLFIIYTFYSIKPDIVHLITIKSYLYGGISARILRVPSVVSSIAGLGSFFHVKSLKNKIFKFFTYPFFYFAFKHPNQFIIVQNSEDKKILVNWGVLNPKKVKLIEGSGVNLKKFYKFKYRGKIPVICFASRLLRDKGVYDFISAAKIIKKRGLLVKFILAGDIDPDNPTSITDKELEDIRYNGNVEVVGYKKDIANLYSKCHIICLPSYFGEGLPKSLIEAAAAGRAIITTNHPGCRDAIIPNKTGLKVPIKNPQKLARAMQKLILNLKLTKNMGLEGRKLAEKKFPIEKVVLLHLEIYKNLIKN